MRTPSILAALALSASAHGAVLTAVELPQPGGARHFLIAAPEHPTAGKRALVLLFHGHMGSAAQVIGPKNLSAMSVWRDIADREQVLVIAPDGIKGSDGHTGWNDCRADAKSSPRSDDTGFVNAIIDQAIAQYDADPSRVYLMGTSNGGGMVLRLASEIAPRLAGFAAVAMSAAANSACPAPSVPLSALFIAGTGDKVVPYAGGQVHILPWDERGSVIGVEQTAALWRALDKLPAAAVTSPVAHRADDDPTRATRYVWGADPHKLQVELLKIEHGGHTEPSMSRRFGWVIAKLLGAQNGDIEAAEEAWQFFRDKRSAQ
jgi:polyhydroxybutyrate depolymerase